VWEAHHAKKLSGTIRITLFHRGHNLDGDVVVPVRGQLKSVGEN